MLIKKLIPIILCVAVIGGSILFLITGYPYKELQDWANFATYLGVSLSIISVVFIYLTYQSQVTMSSVLQFESTFFQWYQIHTELQKDLKAQIAESVQSLIIPKLKSAEFVNLDIFESLAQDEIARPLHRYYRSMYQLFKYIKLSPILSSYKQRKKYYDIIQSNMSDDELILFLCFVLGDYNRDKKVIQSGFQKISFKELVDEGHILKNCYVEDVKLLKRMLIIVRSNFPKTAIKSFHFFTEEYCNKESIYDTERTQQAGCSANMC